MAPLAGVTDGMDDPRCCYRVPLILWPRAPRQDAAKGPKPWLAASCRLPRTSGANGGFKTASPCLAHTKERERCDRECCPIHGTVRAGSQPGRNLPERFDLR